MDRRQLFDRMPRSQGDKVITKILRGILRTCALFFIVGVIICMALALIYSCFGEMTSEIAKEVVESDTLGFRYFVQGFLLLIYLEVTK